VEKLRMDVDILDESPRGLFYQEPRAMKRIQAPFVGVELYFENLDRAKKFYAETLGLEISEEHALLQKPA
jgi:hypothetical protein